MPGPSEPAAASGAAPADPADPAAAPGAAPAEPAAAPGATPADLAGARVALVDMPFAGFRQPSLALGLLAAVLRARGAAVSVVDAKLTFAALIGPEAYDAVAGWPAQDLLGDRVFARLTSRPPRTADDDYAREVLAGGHPAHDVLHFGKPPLTPALRAGLEEAARQAPALLEACLAELVALRPHVVGFTLLSAQLTASLALAERVRRALPGALVVFGGPGCRGEMGEELRRRFPAVGVAVGGEGEALLPALVRAHLSGAPAPAADGAGAEAVDLDDLPVPDFTDYFARLAASPLAGTFTPRVPLETSRGCWWGQARRCTFCGQASAALVYRRKSTGRALTEIGQLARTHPGCPVFFTDEIAPRDAFSGLLPGLSAQVPGLEIVYLEVRPDLTRADLEALTAAGVRRLEAGVESLSTPVLKLMRKGTTALHGIRLLKWARELGIHVVWNLLWGIPGEDHADYARMASLVPLLTHLQPPHTVGEVRLDRFSPIWEDPASFGLADVHAVPAYRHVVDLPQPELDRLAYFFAARTDGLRALPRYTQALAAEIIVWKESFPGGGLRYADDGETLTVDDRRVAYLSDELTVLTGAHRAVLLAADDIATAEQLRRAVFTAEGWTPDDAALEDLLEPLLELGLLVHDGGRYLGLPVRAPGRPRREDERPGTSG